MTNNQGQRSDARHMTSEDPEDQSVLAWGDILSASDGSDFDAYALRWFRAHDARSLALAIGVAQMLSGSEFAYEAKGNGSRAAECEGPAGEQSQLPASRVVGIESAAEGSAVSGSATGAPVTIANAVTVEIDGPSAQSMTFAGTKGTLKLEDPQAFTGVISGLAGGDAIDLTGFAYGANTTATYLGNASGGTLTVTDGAKTARIALSGDYLSSSWTLSSDGKGGTTIVDPTTSANWQDLKVGGGGYVRGLDIDPDGTMVGRTDTNGAYLWTGSQWQQVVTSTSMPAAFLAANPVSSGQGVYEIQMAPSNSSIMYMMFDGYVFKSTNKGTTWTQKSFAQINPNTSANANDSYAQYGQKMAVDPNNPDIVYVGTEQNGMFVTTNGGQTWSNVHAIPDGTAAGIVGILFDPAVGGVVNGATQTIFASSYGNGVYQSTNGGVTWTQLSGGPTNVEYAAVSSTGVYYAAGNSNSTLWSYANGKWTQLLNNSGNVESVAINPSNPNEIVVSSPSGYVNVSYNGGSTWLGWGSSGSPNLVSTDIPWLASANEAPGDAYIYLSAGGVTFSPTNPNELILSAGTGVWTMNVPTSASWSSEANLTWTDQSAGIENLVANEIIVPPGGNPVLASWDRPFFYISNSNAYPSTYGPVNSTNIVAGWSLDYASSDPSFLVGLADWYGTEQSGYSTNGGQTWTKFQTEIPGAASSFMGGTIAASTPQDIVWAPANRNQPYYTLNGGASWSPVALPGVSSWSGFDWAYYLDQRSVTADRVLANTFYLYYPGQGVFSTTNGGQSWTKVHSGYIESNSSLSGYNSTIMSVPGEAGNLFYTGGPQSGSTSTTPVPESFYRSTNGGATWTAVPNVLAVSAFGFGAAAPGQSYPVIYIVGYVNNVYGVWQSINNAQSWTKIGTYPTGELDQISTISGDPNHYGGVYVGFGGGGYAYLPASSTSASPVTVTYYLANQATLDALGNIAISDTSANVSKNIDALNADAHVTAITLSDAGTPTLSLNVAQALNDTHALGAITNVSYAIDVADTAAHLQTLSAPEIANLAADGLRLLDAADIDVAFTAAQNKALGAAGIALEQPYSGGTYEVLTYYSSGVLETAQYFGIVGQPYTSYTITYATSGKPTSASYSNGMTTTWTYNANGSYDVTNAGVTGLPYTSYTVDYGSNRKPMSASYSNGMTTTWTYNADNSFDAAFASVTGAQYSSYEIVYDTAKVAVATAEDMTNGSGALVLHAPSQTISSSSGALSLKTGADTFNLSAHSTEAITAGGFSSETFAYASGFGQSSITGLLGGGNASDVVELNLSMFGGLSSSNTPAQDLALLLSSGAAAQSGSNVTITDSAHDVLTLIGLTTTTLSQNANSVFKFG